MANKDGPRVIRLVVQDESTIPFGAVMRVPDRNEGKSDSSPLKNSPPPEKNDGQQRTK